MVYSGLWCIYFLKGASMDNDCIFCKIINGGLKSSKAYEDDYFVGIMDIAPIAKGHVIVITNEHVRNIFDLEDGLSSRIMPVIRKVAVAVKEATGCEGINIVQNNEPCAGQSVMHFHMHVIPQYAGEELNITSKRINYDGNEMADYARRIAANIGQA